MLSHDRMAEVLVRLFDEGTFARLGVDAELLGLRRFVALHSALFSSGEVEQATRVPGGNFRRIEQHAVALLWGEDRQRWWTACQERRRSDRRRQVVRWGMAAAIIAAVSLGAWVWADRRARNRALLEQVRSHRDPKVAVAAMHQLMATLGDWRASGTTNVGKVELLAALCQRKGSLVKGPHEGDPDMVYTMQALALLCFEGMPDQTSAFRMLWTLDDLENQYLLSTTRTRHLRYWLEELLLQLQPPPPVIRH